MALGIRSLLCQLGVTFSIQRPPTFLHLQSELQWIEFFPLSELLWPYPSIYLYYFQLDEVLMNFQMFKLDLEKAEEPEIKLPTSVGSSKKQESSRKPLTSALLTMPKPLIVWITINCGKFWKGWEYQTTWPVSWETCMQIRKQQLELDMEQQTVPNQKRSMSRLYIVTLFI